MFWHDAGLCDAWRYCTPGGRCPFLLCGRRGLGMFRTKLCVVVVMHRSFGCICGRRSATTTATATTATERSPRPVPDRWSDKKGRDWGDLTWEKLCCRYCGHLLRAFVACAVDSQQARRETRNHQNSPPGRPVSACRALPRVDPIAPCSVGHQRPWEKPPLT